MVTDIKGPSPPVHHKNGHHYQDHGTSASEPDLGSGASHQPGPKRPLREYYPAALKTFPNLADRDTLAMLGRALTPSTGARLTVTQIRAALKTGGRRRNLDTTARRIQAGLRGAHLSAAGPVEDAYGTTVASLLILQPRIIAETNRQITELEATIQTRFEQHPDAVIYLSQPDGDVVIGETGPEIPRPPRFACRSLIWGGTAVLAGSVR